MMRFSSLEENSAVGLWEERRAQGNLSFLSLDIAFWIWSLGLQQSSGDNHRSQPKATRQKSQNDTAELGKEPGILVTRLGC